MAQSSGWCVEIRARKQGAGRVQQEFGMCISSLHWHWSRLRNTSRSRSGKSSSCVAVSASPEHYHLWVLIQRHCKTRQEIWCPISCWLAGRCSKETWEIPFLNKKPSCQHQLIGINANKPFQSLIQPCHVSASHYCITLCKSTFKKMQIEKKKL